MCPFSLSQKTKYRICDELNGVFENNGLAEDLVSDLYENSNSLEDFLEKAGKLYLLGKSFKKEELGKVKEEGESYVQRLVRKTFQMPVVSNKFRNLHQCSKSLSYEFGDLKKGPSPLKRRGAVKCEVDVDHHLAEDDSIPEAKRSNLCKTVSFNNLLEEVYDIPPKEETWPYGSLYGEMEPVAFSEYKKLYDYDTNNNDDKSKGEDCDEEEEGDSDFDLSDSSDSEVDGDDDAECTNNDDTEVNDYKKLEVSKCLGKAYLLKNGHLVQIVSVLASKNQMWGKVFMRFEEMHDKLVDEQKHFRLSEEDYIETDVYDQVDPSSIVSQCFIKNVCSNNNNPQNNSKEKLKVFLFMWYYCTNQKKLYPYPLYKKVRVFWPADQQYYVALADTSLINEKGQVCLNYEVDNSIEYVDLVKITQEKNLEIIG